MRRIKIPQQYFALKMQGGGGLMREGGVFAGHYGTYKYNLRLKTPLVPDAPAQL